LQFCASLVFYNSVVVNLLDYYLPMVVSVKHCTEKSRVNDRFSQLIKQRHYAWQNHWRGEMP